MKVIMVTGFKHTGKTTLVERFITSMDGKGVRISGILARGSWKNDLRDGFDLVDLSDGSSVPLARRLKHPDSNSRVIFEFFEAGMEAGARALAPDRNRESDIVIVDEVGKLEAVGEGWAFHIRELLELRRPIYIWVVRTDFLGKIRKAFDLRSSTVVSIEESDALEHLQVVVGEALGKA